MPFLCSIPNAVCGQSSFLHRECCVVFKSTTDSILYFLFVFFFLFFLFFSVFLCDFWSNLFPVCAVLCVFNCFWICIAACAMQTTCIPWILRPPSGYKLDATLSTYKCRVHFLSITRLCFHERKLVHELILSFGFSFHFVLSISFSFSSASHVLWQYHLHCDPWEGDTVFCRSFHSWFGIQVSL